MSNIISSREFDFKTKSAFKIATAPRSVIEGKTSHMPSGGISFSMKSEKTGKISTWVMVSRGRIVLRNVFKPSWNSLEKFPELTGWKIEFTD